MLWLLNSSRRPFQLSICTLRHRFLSVSLNPIRMPQNVEVKAKVNNFEGLMEKARDLCKCEGTIIEQDDTFFCTEKGRLKLRVFKDGNGELIFYDRPDTEGPKVSDFSKSSTSDPKSLRDVLKLALGIKGSVQKTRFLFMYGQTRIHIDQVVGLGNFMELEVMLKDGQSLDDGAKISDEILELLGVAKSDLICGAYMDWLANKSE